MPLIVVEEKHEWGLYVWVTPNGRIFKDNDGNVMNIPGMLGDIVAMRKITEVARAYGLAGKPQFLTGTRRVSEMEHSEQKDRMAEGYIPSETDFGAWIDAKRGYAKHGSD